MLLNYQKMQDCLGSFQTGFTRSLQELVLGMKKVVFKRPTHENICSDIYKQQHRCRSACTFVQSDQHLCCLLSRNFKNYTGTKSYGPHCEKTRLLQANNKGKDQSAQSDQRLSYLLPVVLRANLLLAKLQYSS